MTKQKQGEKRQENLEENELSLEPQTEPLNVKPQRTLYEVVVVNKSRREETTPHMLTIALGPEEARSIIYTKLSQPWQQDDLDFYVRPF